MFEPKIPAISASIGFVLSFLIGLFSGATFVVMFFRALGMSVLFAVLSVGAWFLVSRFLPELISGEHTGSESPSEMGNSIDITIGEPGKEDVFFQNGSGAGDEDFLNNNVPDFLDAVEPTVSGESSSENTQMNAEGHMASLSSSRTSASASEKKGSSKSEKPLTVGGLDVLPDLQDFIPPVTNTASDEIDDDSQSGSSGFKESSFVSSEITGSGAESETMAKAIRTILAKDN